MEALIEAAEIAEDSGLFDSVWVGDNVLSKPGLEAIVLLRGLATRTRRVKLSTVCLATFPMRSPLVFAIQWASLDVLSHGRTLLVVCGGGPARYSLKFAAELAATGVHTDERIGRVEEGIGVLRRLWREEEVTFRGGYYTLKGVTLLPRPVQPRPQIGIAVNPALHATPATGGRCGGWPGWPTAGRPMGHRPTSLPGAGVRSSPTPASTAARAK